MGLRRGSRPRQRSAGRRAGGAALASPRWPRQVCRLQSYQPYVGGSVRLKKFRDRRQRWALFSRVRPQAPRPAAAAPASSGARHFCGSRSARPRAARWPQEPRPSTAQSLWRPVPWMPGGEGLLLLVAGAAWTATSADARSASRVGLRSGRRRPRRRHGNVSVPAGRGSAGAPGTWAPAGRRHREPPARVMMVSWRPSSSAVAVGGVASPGTQASSEGLHRDRARSWMVPEGLCRPSEGTVWPHPGTSHTRAALAGKACSGHVVCVRRQGGSGHGFWLLCGAAGDLRGGARPGAGHLRPGSATRSGCTPDGRADLRSPVSCACDGQVHGPLYRLPHREAPAAPALWWPAAGPQRREV